MRREMPRRGHGPNIHKHSPILSNPDRRMKQPG
jgi:hypothetical protein